ncbi:MAG: glucose-6-phosphate dehydrogenase [Patescibacteria group bacterium]|jgi:glucose-6-phosphate 1-dehydrogenase
MKKFLIVVFGITSNLAKVKLIPALFELFAKGYVKDVCIIGLSHRERSREDYKRLVRESIKEKVRGCRNEDVEEFLSKFQFLSGDVENSKLYEDLKESIYINGECDNRIFYLATHPNLYGSIFKFLNKSGLTNKSQGRSRLMIEKPLGYDLESAKKLNMLLGKYYSEDQIFRIDHYLGKETIQNILAFRFGNKLFDSIMDAEHIDHIQITAAETIGVESRSSYYDQVGALKDVGQNHLLQMLTFSTMEEPKNFDNTGITEARLKVLEALVPKDTSLVLGQYVGYKDENGAKTNTFFALKTELSRGRFKGIPIYLRAGKKLKEDVAEIAIVFKNEGRKKNVLFFRVQPNEGVIVRIMVKKPGLGLSLEEGLMQFCYKSLNRKLANPYVKLIFDALNEDQTFYNDSSEVEAQWKFIDGLNAENQLPISYKPGTWGPKEAEELIKRDGREWIEPSGMYCR